MRCWIRSAKVWKSDGNIKTQLTTGVHLENARGQSVRSSLRALSSELDIDLGPETEVDKYRNSQKTEIHRWEQTYGNTSTAKRHIHKRLQRGGLFSLSVNTCLWYCAVARRTKLKLLIIDQLLCLILFKFNLISVEIFQAQTASEREKIV